MKVMYEVYLYGIDMPDTLMFLTTSHIEAYKYGFTNIGVRPSGEHRYFVKKVKYDKKRLDTYRLMFV